MFGTFFILKSTNYFNPFSNCSLNSFNNIISFIFISFLLLIRDNNLVRYINLSAD